MRAWVEHFDSTLSSNWRDDAPQVVSASNHGVLHNAHVPCFILCYLLEGFLNSVKGHFCGFQVFYESVFLYFPSLHLPGRRSLSSSFFPCKPCHGSISLAPSILWLAIPAATDLVFCLLFFFSLLSKEEVFPNPTYTWFSSHHSPNPSTVRFSPQPVSTAHLSVFFSLCLQRIVEALLA